MDGSPYSFRTLDLFQEVSFYLFCVDNVNSKMNLYSLIPKKYKTSALDAVFTFVEYVPGIMTMFAYSCVCAIPAMLAHCIQHILNSLAVTIKHNNDSICIGRVLSDCRKVKLSLQWMNVSLASGLLVHHLVAGVQQAIELYVTLKMIHYDVPFVTICFFLLDVIVSSSSLTLKSINCKLTLIK